MKYAFPLLCETKGSIVNFASGTGIIGMLEYGSYASSKEAVRGLSRVAANEWGPYGINVNVICPVVMSNGMKEWVRMYPEVNEQTLKTIPLRRYGDAEADVGRLCVFLCSDDASYITGETIQIDGGSVLRA